MKLNRRLPPDETCNASSTLNLSTALPLRAGRGCRARQIGGKGGAKAARNDELEGRHMTGSEEMRIVDIKGAGGPEVLTVATRPLPEPGPGEMSFKGRALIRRLPVLRNGRGWRLRAWSTCRAPMSAASLLAIV